MLYTYQGLVRRMQDDKDIPEIVRPHLWLILGILKNFQSDSQRLRTFSPAVGYDDLWQELAVTLAITTPQTYDPSKGIPIAAYAHVLLGRKLLNLIRAERYHLHNKSYDADEALLQQIEEDESASVDEASSVVEAVETAREVYTFAQSLTDRQRRIFTLAYEENASRRQIAAQLGTSPATVTRDCRLIALRYECTAMQFHLPLPQALWDAEGQGEDDT